MKVAALVSGGVDSSVALHRLKDRYDSVHAYYLKIWLEDDADFAVSCPWEEDLQYLRAICTQLDVALSIIPLQQSYYDTIVRYVLDELRHGATPSPDVLCNSRIKFGAFLDTVEDSFDVVASGHYAQLEHQERCTRLRLSADADKDQTYFLSHLSQSQLAQLVFPVGNSTKQDLRREAATRGLPNHDRRDSQGICFLGKIRYSDFIAHYLGERPGAIVDKHSGKVLGTHRGYWFYTPGQRRGLELGGGPWYVVGKQHEENVVYVAHARYSMQYTRESFFLDDTNWIPEAPKDGPLRVKIRHSPDFLPGYFQSSPRPQLRLGAKDKGVAEGQFAVLYRDTYCLGGGRIRFS